MWISSLEGGLQGVPVADRRLAADRHHLGLEAARQHVLDVVPEHVLGLHADELLGLQQLEAVGVLALDRLAVLGRAVREVAVEQPVDGVAVDDDALASQPS